LGWRYHEDMAQPAHVKLSGDIEGSYVVEEKRPDGMLLIAPEWPSENTRAAAIIERAGAEPLSPDEFDRHFGHLPTDGEG
jgi:hypothetical protein